MHPSPIVDKWHLSEIVDNSYPQLPLLCNNVTAMLARN